MKAPVRILAGAAFAAGVIAVAVLCLLPQEAVPHLDVGDKAQHLIAYLCLALAGGVAFPGRSVWVVVGLGLGLVALGIGLEVGQAFVPGRYASMGDAAANTLGVVIGLTVARVASARAGLSV